MMTAGSATPTFKEPLSSKVVRVLLIVRIPVYLIGVVLTYLTASSYVYDASVDYWMPGGMDSPGIDLTFGILKVLTNLLAPMTAIVFLMWFHSVHTNLSALGNMTLRYKSRWTTLSFFIPIVNFVLPVLVMREVWNGSDPSVFHAEQPVSTTTATRKQTTAGLVLLWWICFLTPMIYVIRLCYYAYYDLLTPPDGFRYITLFLLLEMISAVVTIRLVGRITRMQAERYAKINPGGLMSCE